MLFLRNRCIGVGAFRGSASVWTSRGCPSGRVVRSMDNVWTGKDSAHTVAHKPNHTQPPLAHTTPRENVVGRKCLRRNVTTKRSTLLFIDG
jgi:hypothetical protein